MKANSIPSVALYIPCYNASRYLPDVIAGVLSQSLKPSEILLVDDGSSDGSAELARRLGIKVESHKENQGVSTARNTAINNTSAEFIASVDADVVPSADWLAKLVETMVAKNIDAISGKTVEKQTGRMVDRWRERVVPLHHGDEFKTGMLLYGSNMVIRRKSLLAAGGYESRLRTGFEDMHLSNALLDGGFVTAYEPTAICYHQRSDTLSSIARTVFNYRNIPLRSHGIFSNITSLTSTCSALIEYDLDILKDIAAKGDARLGGVSLYVICTNTQRAFMSFLANNQDLCDARIILVAFLLLINSLFMTRGLPAALLEKLSEKLFDEFIVQAQKIGLSIDRSEVQEYVQEAKQGKLDRALVALDWTSAEKLTSLADLFRKIPTQFSFEASLWEQIEEGFLQALGEDS